VPIQTELKQTKPFRSRGEEAAVALLRTADLMRRSIGLILAPHGLSVQQYNVLRILRGAGDDGLPTLEIAERAIEWAPGITRLVDTLEEKKLVTRKRCEQDRRRVWCRITPAGLALLKELDAPMVAAADRALKPVSSRELVQLVGLLDRLREDLNDTLSIKEEVSS
jgi:DNA-binding MarR family transcriptional regulator